MGALVCLAFMVPAADAAPRKGGKSKPCRATKKGAVYHSPGYKGVCRASKTKPQDPLPPVELGDGGRSPQVLVDAAGTAHIVWNQDGGDTGPDQLRYCRLKRGATSCDKTAALIPQQPGLNNSPAFNEDIAGPRIVAVGDDLVFISHRYPNVVAKPDATSTDRTTYAWISDDGGNTITGPVIVGDAEPSGGAVVYGTPDGPRIGLISDTRTGGTFFQQISPGTYTSAQANLGAGGPDRAYSGSLVSVGGLPVTAFADLAGNTFIRQWSGTGNPANPATWSQAQTSGSDPRLAAGPSGAFLVTSPQSGDRFQVRKLAGINPGRAATVKTGSHGARDFFEDPGGALRLAWVDRDGDDPRAARALLAGRAEVRGEPGDRPHGGRHRLGRPRRHHGRGRLRGLHRRRLLAGLREDPRRAVREPGAHESPGDRQPPGRRARPGHHELRPGDLLRRRPDAERARRVPLGAGQARHQGHRGHVPTSTGSTIVPDAGVKVQMSTKSGAKTIDSVNGRVTRAAPHRRRPDRAVPRRAPHQAPGHLGGHQAVHGRPGEVRAQDQGLPGLRATST